MKKIFATLLLISVILTGCARRETVELMKLEELSTPNCPLYTLAFTGYRPGIAFDVVSVDSAGQTFSYGKAWTDPCGNLIRCAGGEWVPFQIGLPNYGPGEYIDIWLSCEYRAHIVPHPIHIMDKGYDLYLEKDDHLAHNWKVIAGGFEPEEIVSVVTYADNRILTDCYRASCEGGLIIPVNASVEGKGAGETRMVFEGSHGEITLVFPWGESWFEWKKQFLANKQREDYEHRQEVLYYQNQQRLYYECLMEPCPEDEIIFQATFSRD